jgi:hypothetical protein
LKYYQVVKGGKKVKRSNGMLLKNSKSICCHQSMAASGWPDGAIKMQRQVQDLPLR